MSDNGPSFEQFVPPELAVVAMRRRLEAVDRAIGELHDKASAGAAVSSAGAEGAAVGARSSSLLGALRPLLIDTHSKQFSTCPHCYLAMPLAQLRQHMASQCPSLLITCPEIGCGASFPSTELGQHQQSECAVILHRRRLVAQAQQRKQDKLEAAQAVAAAAAAAKAAASSAALPSYGYDYAETYGHYAPAPAEEAPPEPEAPPYMCPLCAETMLHAQRQQHALSCRLRPVYCPNRPFGCMLEVTLAAVQMHLLHDCRIEKRKAVMVARCNKRREAVRCVGCGDFFPLAELRVHESELCANRKVACRNAHLGCLVTMRASKIKAHEEVDNAKARVRYCLYLNGLGASIALHEDDVPAPWTAEYWLYRPAARESAKQYLKAALLLGPPLVDAFMHEHLAKDHVETVTALLSDKSLRLGPEEREAAMELLAEVRSSVGGRVRFRIRVRPMEFLAEVRVWVRAAPSVRPHLC